MKYMFLYLVPVLRDTINETSGITLSGLAKILALIGTLFAVLNAPSGISQLIGADLSVSSSLQSLQTTMIGTGLLGGALRTAGTAARDVGALSIYGGGRMMGGSSISQQIQNIASGALSPLVSARSIFGGLQDGIQNLASSSNHGVGDFVSDLRLQPEFRILFFDCQKRQVFRDREDLKDRIQGPGLGCIKSLCRSIKQSGIHRTSVSCFPKQYIKQAVNDEFHKQSE